MIEQTTQEQLVLARASIHLPGLPLGHRATVDLSEPYVAEAIERGYLVPEQVVTDAASEPTESPAG